ncbi:hypothetical protein LMG7141_03796 [Ralstonia condita]|uniref:Uncharacterized protein n=1 Tax=Ralstonia condita TaxID=3058600 RepID=A0ABN9J6F5_9RALS|nr:HAD domain-containing protein [Ralstonia sp. LMG 7141]CAJ0800251.1 hypothetical protein LMG7141_03796 [Ralstonia sp. LMG 7141]
MQRQYRTAASHLLNLASRPMRAVLFLGYDGCLHPMPVSHTGHEPILHDESSAFFEHASDLAMLLAPYPDIDIVLSTDWVGCYGAAAAISHLPEPLQQRVVGTIDEFNHDPLKPVLVSKFDRIMYYVTRRRVDFWLAVHFDDGAWPRAFITHLVWSDPHLGIGKQTIRDDLKDKLCLLNARSQRWRW